MSMPAEDAYLLVRQRTDGAIMLLDGKLLQLQDALAGRDLLAGAGVVDVRVMRLVDAAGLDDSHLNSPAALANLTDRDLVQITVPVMFEVSRQVGPEVTAACQLRDTENYREPRQRYSPRQVVLLLGDDEAELDLAGLRELGWLHGLAVIAE